MQQGAADPPVRIMSAVRRMPVPLARMPSVTHVTNMDVMAMAAAMAVSRVTAVASGVAMSRVATAKSSKRHGREAGCSKKQQECVRIHVSIDAVGGAARPSTVRDGPRCRYICRSTLCSAGNFERWRTARSR